MSQKNPLKIALVGNANIGKTTLFNKLCGLNQHTGNYPGVTIDKKKGIVKNIESDIELIDLPGINSLYPSSTDEELVSKYLQDINSSDYPDKVIVVASALNLKKNLYLFDQIRDLNIPLVLVINMIDLAKKRGYILDLKELEQELGVPVVGVSAKKEEGLEDLKKVLTEKQQVVERPIHYLQGDDLEVVERFAVEFSLDNPYLGFLKLTQNLDKEIADKKQAFIEENEIKVRSLKTNASILRYKYIKSFLDRVLTIDESKATDFTSKADRILLHPIGGYAIFALILLIIFQAIFWLASYPMDWIDTSFSELSEFASTSLPAGYFSRLICEGLIPGLGGVFIFIPQITILFLLFSLLEESGYMTRIVYLTDRLMQKFGMSGKSIVPMISGLACAVPAIMAARTIENKRERLITILVTPLLTCSARLPVYILIIALVIPEKETIGIFNKQGLALMGLYLLGVVMTFVVALILKFTLKPTYKSYLLIEMPEYLRPDAKNVLIRVWTNVKSFIWNAGRIIVATAIILFVLATNGGEQFNNAESFVKTNSREMSSEEFETEVEAFKIENSYLGMVGKGIEPLIAPMGYDWKIGIALISSLAAREVFVGTISIIYAINSDEPLKIRDRLKREVDPKTGEPMFGMAVCVSLLLFYAFSLQCMSTVAITYKETKSVKWTAVQFLYMGILAYFSAFVAYQLLS